MVKQAKLCKKQTRLLHHLNLFWIKHHINNFDREHTLANQKYSLTYYLTVGDQNCDEPGILKLYNPDEEILPSEGTIVIFPANRLHSATYGGKSDRIMIGVNFYSLI